MKYENAEVKLRAVKKVPRIQTPGVDVPETPEGHEFMARFWVAQELVESGVAEYSESALTPTEWTQVHFRERVNPAGPPGRLPDGFYERAYQSFVQARGDPEKTAQLLRMKAWFREILESRIGRITRLASSEAVSSTSALTKDEADLYEDVHRVVTAWRDRMRALGET